MEGDGQSPTVFDVKEVETRAGGSAFLINGFLYTKNKVNKDHIYLKCRSYHTGCRARAKLISPTEAVLAGGEQSAEHTHPPPDLLQIIFKADLRRASRDKRMSNMSVKDIYNSTLTKVAAEVLGSDNNLGDNEDFFARLPPINSVETTMKRIRVKEEISDSSPSAKRKKAAPSCFEGKSWLRQTLTADGECQVVIPPGGSVVLSNCTGRSYSFNVPAALNYTQMTQMNKLAARPSLKPPKIPTVKKTVSIRGVRGKPKETESNVAVRQLIQAENNTSSDESHLGNGYLGELGAEEEISQGDSKSPNVRQPPPQQLPQQKFARLQIGTKNVIMVPVTMLKSK